MRFLKLFDTFIAPHVRFCPNTENSLKKLAQKLRRELEIRGPTYPKEAQTRTENWPAVQHRPPSIVRTFSGPIDPWILG